MFPDQKLILPRVAAQNTKLCATKTTNDVPPKMQMLLIVPVHLFSFLIAGEDWVLTMTGVVASAWIVTPSSLSSAVLAATDTSAVDLKKQVSQEECSSGEGGHGTGFFPEQCCPPGNHQT